MAIYRPNGTQIGGAYGRRLDEQMSTRFYDNPERDYPAWSGRRGVDQEWPDDYRIPATRQEIDAMVAHSLQSPDGDEGKEPITDNRRVQDAA